MSGRYPREMKIDLTSRRLTLVLAGIAAALGAAHLAAAAVLNTIGYQRAHDLGLVFALNQFNLDEEMNFPTYFSSFLLAFAGGLLLAMAHQVRRTGAPMFAHWRVLAFGFFCMSFDEFAALHERVGSLLRLRLHVTEWHGFRVNWIVAGLPLIILIGCAYIPFLRRLPALLRNRLISAGAVYIGGLVGMEIISTRYARVYGEQNMTYAWLTLAEELAEMGGVILLIRAIAGELARASVECHIRLTGSAVAEPPIVPAALPPVAASTSA
jgi:hypothetical protein